MLHGNLSNRQAPIIAFNVDNLLFMDEVKSTALQKLLSKFKTEKSKMQSREINTDFVNILNNLWNSYDYSIYLITFNKEEEYEECLYDILDKNGACYTLLIKYSTWDELREINSLQYTYYFDTNEELISYLGAGALHIKEIHNILKTGGRVNGNK